MSTGWSRASGGVCQGTSLTRDSEGLQRTTRLHVDWPKWNRFFRWCTVHLIRSSMKLQELSKLKIDADICFLCMASGACNILVCWLGTQWCDTGSGTVEWYKQRFNGVSDSPTHLCLHPRGHCLPTLQHNLQRHKLEELQCLHMPRAFACFCTLISIRSSIAASQNISSNGKINWHSIHETFITIHGKRWPL